MKKATSRKSRRGDRVERAAQDFVLLDSRFQRPARIVKARTLELFGVTGSWSASTFDLVMTPQPVEPLTIDNVARHIDRIWLVEIKATAARIRNCGLAGFFFGSTETQFLLAAAVAERFRYAFVVLNEDNDYGRPFFSLLTPRDVLEKIHTKRVQHQVNFKSGLNDPFDVRVGPWPQRPVQLPDSVVAVLER